MKKLIANTLMLFLLIGLGSKATAQKTDAQLLPAYLSLKDALVSSDANSAALKAAELEKAIKNLDVTSLAGAEKNNAAALKTKLGADATKIASGKDIAKQRTSFETLSLNMIAFSKLTKVSDQPLYVQYCPMKKASWLSSEKEIKNPYYGKQMLTCGNVKETI